MTLGTRTTRPVSLMLGMMTRLDADCVAGPVACPDLEPFITKPRPLWIEHWEASEIVPEDEDEARFVPLVEIITRERDIRKIKQFVAVWLAVRVRWVHRALYPESAHVHD